MQHVFRELDSKYFNLLAQAPAVADAWRTCISSGLGDFVDLGPYERGLPWHWGSFFVADRRGTAQLFDALRKLRPEERELIDVFDPTRTMPSGMAVLSTSGTTSYRLVPLRVVRRWAGLLRYVRRRELWPWVDEGWRSLLPKLERHAHACGLHRTPMIVFEEPTPPSAEERLSTAIARIAALRGKHHDIGAPARPAALAAARASLGAHFTAAISELYAEMDGFTLSDSEDEDGEDEDGEDMSYRSARLLPLAELRRARDRATDVHGRDPERVRYFEFGDGKAVSLSLLGLRAGVWIRESAPDLSDGADPSEDDEWTARDLGELLTHVVEPFDVEALLETSFDGRGDDLPRGYTNALRRLTSSRPHVSSMPMVHAPKNRFAPLIDRLRALASEDDESDLDDDSESDDTEHALFRIRPPATDADRAKLEATLGSPLPAELSELLDVTLGVEDVFELESTSATSLWANSDKTLVSVYDWGNGDRLYLDVIGGACTLWWLGHDPYEHIFVARSLREYFERVVREAEESGDTDGHAWAPDSELRPVTPAQALVGERDLATRAFLEGLVEDTLVFDLRGVPTPVELIGDNKWRTYVRHGELVARVLHPSERRVRPETGWPEATWHIDLVLGYVKDGLFDQAKGALEKAAELDPEHPRLAEARSELASALSALGGVDPLATVKEARRRFEQGEHVEGLEEPAVVTGVSSIYLQTKHPKLGDIAIFRPTLHTPIHEGDRVRLVGIQSVGRDLLRATDYIVVT